MCGVVGLFDVAAATPPDELAVMLSRMSEAVRHRGPDGHGVWLDAAAGVGLGHQRLAILDLSENGAQPMVSRCGRYVLVFNGEIYNFRALRRELEGLGSSFVGHGDTEVLLDAISRWDILPALSRTKGMFALAVWDREQRELTLARDRLGEKPPWPKTIDAPAQRDALGRRAGSMCTSSHDLLVGSRDRLCDVAS